MADREIERRVFFYGTKVSAREDGTIPVFPLGSLSDSIGKLQFLDSTDAKSRYMRDEEDGHLTCVWPVAGKSVVSRFTIGTVRRRGLPKLERMGRIRPMRTRQGEGILEQTHVVFFQGGIVGAEFNFHGPRMSRFSNYIRDKFPKLPKVKFDPLLNEDAMARLKELQDVRLVRLRMYRNDLALAAQADKDLPSALEATAKQYGAEVIEIVWRANPHEHGSKLRRSIMKFLGGIVGKRALLEQADVLRAQGTNAVTDRVEWFDFLKDKFIYIRAVASTDGRTVDSASMFEAIENAYQKNKSELMNATGVG